MGLNGKVTVPEPVIREAEAAASALLRVTAHPFGYRHWTDYHRKFRAKYGPGASVAVLDLLADSGLGMPTGYLGAAPGPTGRTLSERDETLLAWVQQAMVDERVPTTFAARPGVDPNVCSARRGYCWLML